MLVSTTDAMPVTRPIDETGRGTADVAVVPWPSDRTARSRARATGRPCLLIVDPAVAPPTDCDLHEDWVLATAPSADVRARLRALATRPVPPRPVVLDAAVVDELDDRQLLLLAALDVRPGRITPRHRLTTLVDSHDDVTAVLATLRRRLSGGGIELVELPGDGDVLLVRIPAAQAVGAADGRTRAGGRPAT
jgi:hypothetical protein